VLPAPSELGVERIESFGVQLTDLEMPEERRDVIAHVAPVQRKGVRRGVELIEVALE
jgi:hypothetical protein